MPPPAAPAHCAALPLPLPLLFPLQRLPMRYVRCGKACWSGEERDERILQLCFDIAISLIIVGVSKGGAGLWLTCCSRRDLLAALWG